MRAELEALLGPAAVSERPVFDLWPRGVIRRRAGFQPAPSLVARPATYEQVSSLLAWASSRGTAVTPLGGGSGVCGAVDPGPGEVVLDLGALDRILELDETHLRVRAQAGLNGMRLEDELRKRALKLGHYPSSLPVATVGGLISTRSSGQESTLYGNAEDMVLGLTVVLPDGRLVESRPSVRSAAGPALHQLFVGAEGTLGVIVEADLRVHPVQPERGTGYRFTTLAAGLEAMRGTIQAGLRPMVMRLYDEDDTQFQAAGLDSGCLLVVGVTGPLNTLAGAMEAVATTCAAGASLGPEPWDRWLRHRYDLSAGRLLDFLKPAGSYVDTIELAAPWARLEELHSRVTASLKGAGALALCHFSHASGQGACAYFTFAGSAATEAEAESAYRGAWEGAMAAALALGATITHHHGVGQARAPWLASELGGWAEVWRSVRTGLDPGRTMNRHGMGGL